MNQNKSDQGDQVVNVNPRHPLVARPDAPAQPQTERGQHPFQRAATGIKNNADAQRNNANPQRFGGQRFPLPGDAYLGKETGSGRRAFRQNFAAPRAVVADGGSADENFGWLSQCGHGFDRAARTLDTAVEDALLGPGRPPLGYWLAGQMNDGICSLQDSRVPSPPANHGANRSIR